MAGPTKRKTSANGSKVHTGTLASILAQSPTSGDVGIPSDSPYRLIYDGTAWRYSYSGWAVTPPVSGDWSSFALAGTSSISYADGSQVINVDQTVTADRQGSSHAITEGNKYTFACRYLMLGGQGATSDFMGVGFRSSADDKGLILDVRNEVSSSLNANFTIGRVTAWDGSIVKMKETDRLERNDLWLFVQLQYASGTLTFRLAQSPQGPWVDFYSESDTAHFTSDPDQVVFWAMHRSGEVTELPITLVGFTSESA